MSHFHQDCALRMHHAQVHLAYDGSVVVETFCEVIGPDGKTTELRHGYGHRIAPNRWHGLTLPEALKETLEAHHEALGLNPPDETLPLHLHAQGYPGTTHYAPVPDKPHAALPADHEQQVRASIDRAKRAEMYGPAERR